MTSLINYVIEKNTEIWEENSDPMINSWLLMESPLPVLTILLLYLYVVLKLGPQLMKNLPPFKLRRILIVYNLFQVIFNLWLASFPFKVENVFLMLFKRCGTFGKSSENNLVLSVGFYWYFISKVIDLLDTVFFVLRKKQSQVTFLHVYHHSFMVAISWAGVKTLAGEVMIIPGFLNVCVHVLMYLYYTIAALGPKYQKYLWWKRYLTKIQIIQFVSIILYLAYVIGMNCPVSKGLSAFVISYVTIFLYLFADFYSKEYLKNAKTNSGETKDLNKEF